VKLLDEIGFCDIEMSAPYDTFGGAGGEDKARKFGVFGYAFMAIKPG
jgi:hypothetical protein